MKTLLDDAAAYATADLSIDLTSIRQRAAREQTQARRIRRRGGLVAALAVAATIALIAVLFPDGSVLRGSVLPADRPDPLPPVTGVPANWYYAPAWTPPVTRHRMTAAVMVLEASLANGSGGVRGPVLVSADGRTYASLPSWSVDDQSLVLSRNGREAAWYTGGGGSAPGVIHRLTLATGHRVDVDGSSSSALVSSLAWDGDTLVATEQEPGFPVRWSVIRIPADGTPVRGPQMSTEEPPQRSSSLVVSPDGQWSAVGTLEKSTWSIDFQPYLSAGANSLRRTGQRTSIAVRSADPVTRMVVLAWTAAGIFVRLDTSPPGQSVFRSIRVIDPETGAMQVVSRQRGTGKVFPTALAPGLIASATPIAVPPPQFSAWDRSRVVQLANRALARYPLFIRFNAIVTLVVLVTGLAYWLRTSRRRRARRSSGDENNETVVI